MDIKVHCPGCRAILNVLFAAAGHIARCPACHTVFQVPDPDDIVEQTISSWIEEDVDDLQHETDAQWKQRLKEEAAERKQKILEQQRETADKIAAVMELNKIKKQSTTTTIIQNTNAQNTIATQENHIPNHADSSKQKVALSNPNSAPPPLNTTTQTETETETETKNTSTAPNKLLSSAPHAIIHYPTTFTVATSMPHLVVTECTLQGVLFAFDFNYLKNERFRLSMPLGCAFTNQSKDIELVAKPMAFVDQCKGERRSTQEIEASHERRLIGVTSRHEILKGMGRLESLHDPFDLPFVYYLSSEYFSTSLKCYTKKRKDSRTLCYVLIPDGRFALRWLGHVNGQCGEEFDLLAEDVASLWQSDWTSLDKRVRLRLESWVKFQPSEVFHFYANDADMQKKDRGLAGIVLTDRRLIYHKHHRTGQIEYGENAQLIVQPDGQFAGLTIKSKLGRAKACRFHMDDLEKLRDYAKNLNITLTVAAS